MTYILSGIFGALLAFCGISIVEEPFKAVVLLIFFCTSMEIVCAKAVKS